MIGKICKDAQIEIWIFSSFFFFWGGGGGGGGGGEEICEYGQIHVRQLLNNNKIKGDMLHSINWDV